VKIAGMLHRTTMTPRELFMQYSAMTRQARLPTPIDFLNQSSGPHVAGERLKGWTARGRVDI